MGPFEDRRAADLALVHLVLGADGREFLLHFFDGGIGSVGISRVGMVDPVVDEVDLVGGLEGFEHVGAIGVPDGRDEDDGVGLDVFDEFRRLPGP